MRVTIVKLTVLLLSTLFLFTSCENFLKSSETRNEIESAIAALKYCGADFADMSGSGSTVFGIFAKKKGEEVSSLARTSCETLAKNWRVVLA